MSSPDRAPGAPLPHPVLDRDALARRVFDAAICHPNVSLGLALACWLETIEGIGGYLHCTAEALQPEILPADFAPHLAAGVEGGAV